MNVSSRERGFEFSDLFTIYRFDHPESGETALPDDKSGLEIFFSIFEIEFVALRFQNLAKLRRAAEKDGHLQMKKFHQD